MKKLVLTTLITGALAASVFAQGSVGFVANSTYPIKWSADGTASVNVPVGNPATVGTYGNLNIAAYYATVGTASPFTSTAASLLGSAWTESVNVLRQITPLSGRASTTFTLQSATGNSPVQIMLVGWTGTYLDWNSAYTAAGMAGTALFGWTGSALSGGALAWQNGTGAPVGSPPTTPVAMVTGAGGYNGIVLQSLVPIPEPGTFALAGLGLATLLIFRRRK